MNQGSVLLLLKEDENEFGDGGCDPSTQAGLSSARHWVQSKVSECIVHHVLLWLFVLSLKGYVKPLAPPRFSWQWQDHGP
jgi:hypothetical protein